MVRLIKIDESWLQEFAQTKSSILHATQGWITEVVHIGSTAVPGSIGQPIVDCFAGLDDLNGFADSSQLVQGLNFQSVPLPIWFVGVPGICLEKPRGTALPTHRVFLLPRDSDLWRDTVTLTQQFRLDQEEADRLNQLKRRLYETNAEAEEYSRSVSAFITARLDQIRATRNQRR